MRVLVLPNLSSEEKLNALQKAQEMRAKRAEIRKKLKTGELTLEDVLDMDGEVVNRMRVSYLLESLPRIGKITAKEIMDEIGIDASRRIQGLGTRQKRMLVEKFAK